MGTNRVSCVSPKLSLRYSCLMARRLTEHRVRDLRPKSKRYTVAESGLQLEVHPSGSKVWYARWREKGRPHKEKLGQYPELSLKDARAKLTELQAALVQDSPVKQSAATLREFVDGPFSEWCLAQRKDGEATMDRITHQYLSSPVADKRLRDITTEQVENLKSAQIGKYAPSTVKRNLGDLRRVFSKAVEWGYLRRSPATPVSDPKVDRQGTKLYLTKAELKRLNTALTKWTAKGYLGRTYNDRKAHPLYLTPLVHLLINTGLRKGEALALKWSDVDQKERLIRVRGEITKTGQSREVPISDKLLDELKGWNTAAGIEDLDTDDPMFPITYFRKAWARLMKESKLDITPHHLRHHFASTLVLRGVPLHVVQRLLGHRELTTTQIYLSVRSEDAFEAVNLL